MSKNCWICGKKVNMMNEVPLAVGTHTETVCLRCFEEYKQLLRSGNKQELSQNVTAVMSLLSDDSTAGPYIREDIERLAAKIDVAEVDRKRQEEQAEAERQRMAAMAEAERQRQAELAEAEYQRQMAMAEAERQRQAELAEAERQRREAQEEAERKAAQEKIEKLRENGCEGYYEYLALSLVDEDGGNMHPVKITQLLNQHALLGWRLASAYTNELTRQGSGLGGFGGGNNSTIDQHILILERYIKLP